MLVVQGPGHKGKKPKYAVEVILNEKSTTMFADTGADVSVMSLKTAKQLQLPLNRTKMKICPYRGKPTKCKGYYVGPVMYGDAVTNLRLYVIDKNVETLLSGQASEELGIIKFNNNVPDLRRLHILGNQNIPQNSLIASKVLPDVYFPIS